MTPPLSRATGSEPYSDGGPDGYDALSDARREHQLATGDLVPHRFFRSTFNPSPTDGRHTDTSTPPARPSMPVSAATPSPGVAARGTTPLPAAA